jgi:hypothetical protein
MQREELEQIIIQHEAELARVTAKLTKAESRQQERVEELGDFAQETKELEVCTPALLDCSYQLSPSTERVNYPPRFFDL